MRPRPLRSALQRRIGGRPGIGHDGVVRCRAVGCTGSLECVCEQIVDLVERLPVRSVALHLVANRIQVLHAPAHLAAPALDIPALQLLGDLDIAIAHARLLGAWPEAANGTAHWRNAAVAGAAQAQLGDLEATFASAADGSIDGNVHDLGGPLQLTGTFRLNAGSYDADATLRARDANAQVSEALRYIGEPQADGSSHLVIHGQLFKVF